MTPAQFGVIFYLKTPRRLDARTGVPVGDRLVYRRKRIGPVELHKEKAALAVQSDQMRDERLGFAVALDNPQFASNVGLQPTARPPTKQPSRA